MENVDDGRRVAVTFADGTLGRTQFVGDPTDEEIQAIYDKANVEVWAGNPAVAWRRVTLADFPDNGDHCFGKAWRDDGKAISIDMAKAKEITRDRLRAERVLLLAAQDVESLKAIEAGDTTKLDAVAAEKQRLRDITALPAIDAAKTPDELKAIAVSQPVKEPAATIAETSTTSTIADPAKNARK